MNMIHIWGTSRNDVGKNNYISVLSLIYNETSLLIRFKRLAEYLKGLQGEMTIQEILKDKQITELLIEILDGLERDSDDARFSYNLVSKEYIRFMAYFSEQLASDELNNHARVKALDDIFGEVDTDLIRRFPELNEEEMDVLNNNVRKLLGEKNHTNSQKIFSHNLENYRYNKIEKNKYRDNHLLESIYYIWYINNVIPNADSEGCEIVSYSISKEEISQMFAKFVDVQHSPTFISVIMESPDTYFQKVVEFFFKTLNEIIISVFCGNSNHQMQSEHYEVEKLIFNKTWTAIRKDASLWMVPIESYNGLLSV